MLGGQVSAYEAQMRLGGCRTGVRRGLMRDAVARVSVLHLSYFFYLFFFTDSRRLNLIRADSTSIRAEPGWFDQNRGVSAGNRNGRNRPKSALNHAGTCHPMVGLVMMMIKLSCWSLGLCMELAPFWCFCFKFCIGMLCVCVYKGQRLRCMIDH